MPQSSTFTNDVVTAARCVHRTRNKTCGKPVAALLAPRFEIAFVECAADCPAYEPKPAVETQKPDHRDNAPLTEGELDRAMARMRLLQRRGVEHDAAFDIAYTLAIRDRDTTDKRRMCIECDHLQRDGACFAARQGWRADLPTNYHPARLMLSRCQSFKWAMP